MPSGIFPYDIAGASNGKANEARILDQVARSALDHVQNGIPVEPGPYSQALEDLAAIRRHTYIEVALKRLGLNFNGYVFNLTANVPQQIIQPAKFPRGYVIINPGEVSGFSSNITFYASATRANGFATGSTSFNVSGVDRASLFLNITAITNTPTLVVNAQSQDPLTGNWFNTQTDIFTGAATAGQYYASIGQLGVDDNLRLLATVGNAAGDDITFSISGVLKGNALTPVGSTIYIGPQNVNSTTGWPLLPGSKEYFFPEDDVPLFAVSPVSPVQIKVLHLQ